MCHESVVKDFDAPDRSTWRVSAVPWSRQAHGVCQIGEARAPEILHLAKQYSIVDYSFVGQNATIGDRFARSSLAVTNDALRRISSALILAIEEADACKATRGRDDQFHGVLRHAIGLQGTLQIIKGARSRDLRESSRTVRTHDGCASTVDRGSRQALARRSIRAESESGVLSPGNAPARDVPDGVAWHLQCGGRITLCAIDFIRATGYCRAWRPIAAPFSTPALVHAECERFPTKGINLPAVRLYALAQHKVMNAATIGRRREWASR